MHALWHPEDFAGRRRRPHAAEYDDDECGATALMEEGVGATAYGRFDATAPGKVRLGPHRAAAPPVEGSQVGRRQQNRRATLFLVPGYKCRLPSYASDEHECTQQRAYLPRLTRVDADTCLPTSSDEVRTFLNLSSDEVRTFLNRRRRASNTPQKGGRTHRVF